MRSLIGLWLWVGVSACNKGEEAPPVGQQPNPCGVVSGIHRTDVNGALMYPADSSDWRTTGVWCSAVEDLFADRPAVVLNTTPPDSLMIVCFPNPTSNQFILGFYRDDASYVDVRFVDAQFQLLWALDSMTSPNYLFRADSMGITSPQLIRAYYRVVHADGSAHRGHGDVQIGL